MLYVYNFTLYFPVGKLYDKQQKNKNHVYVVFLLKF